ncbi:MAG TPA: hypothetical protein VGY55_17995 [Pirellulales bacterium]|jgi:hypothetical protein|nr:hypothetical protein [Pirellulales bacterium]
MATSLSGHAMLRLMPTPTCWRRCQRGHGTQYVKTAWKLGYIVAKITIKSIETINQQITAAMLKKVPATGKAGHRRWRPAMSQPRLPNTIPATPIASTVTTPISEVIQANPIGILNRPSFMNIVLKTNTMGDATNTTLPIISDAKPHCAPAPNPWPGFPAGAVEALSFSMIRTSALEMRCCRDIRL